jgi:ubiquinone/menaquinone biosynthesis C-methylase UbiE
MIAHYGTGYERDRLKAGTSRIEFARTTELLGRHLPPPPAAALDVGGGPGAYASWLANAGYRVHLVDPVPLHVEQASEASAGGTLFTASLGDARHLEDGDDSYDVVLLLGPLYHITDRDERVAALAEAGRVVRPDGVVVAAAISRFASLLDGLMHGYLSDPTFHSIVERDLADGQHRNPSDRQEWFTTAYFHRPDELAAEMEDAGLVFDALFGVEGPGWLAGSWDDPSGRDDILRVARALEREPTVIGVSAHLLAFARGTT